MRKTVGFALSLGFVATTSFAAMKTTPIIEIDRDQIGYNAYATSANIELSEQNSQTLNMSVYGTFRASNPCMIPNQDELTAVYTINESNNYQIMVGITPSDRNCPRIYQPVNYTVKILETYVSKNTLDSLSVTVNGKKAN